MNINLLPKKEQKKIRAEYIIRRRIILAEIVMSIIVTSIVMIIPLHLLNSQLQKEVVLHNEQDTENVKNNEIKDAVSALNTKIDTLQQDAPQSMYDVISDIAELSGPNIHIRGFNFSIQDNFEQRLLLSGNADDRDSLLTFKQNLETETYVSSVDLPVSNFAQNTDISFSITIILRTQ